MAQRLRRLGGRETRLNAAEAFREYERAIASMRAGVVHALVDEGGLSLTDVARRMKVSRKRPPGSTSRCGGMGRVVPTKAGPMALRVPPGCVPTVNS